MRYCLARYEEIQLDKAYRVYVTDALRVLTENTAKISGGGYIQRRYVELVEPRKEETRSGDEIIEHMKNVLGKLG